MAVANNAVRTPWQYLDAAGAAKTGMVITTDVTLTLYRETTSGFVAASESATFTEIGSSGFYTIEFTPVNAGLYTLWVHELNADSYARLSRFDFQVQTAGSVFVPSLANAFCSEPDIERWTQTAISSATQPSDTEAAAFAESRAAELMSLCAGAGYSVTPLTVTSGSILEDLLREANAVGAALDYTIAQQFAVRPSKSDRAEWLVVLWREKAAGIEKHIRMNLKSLSTDHIIGGDTTAATVGSAPVSAGIGVTMGELY